MAAIRHDVENLILLPAAVVLLIAVAPQLIFAQGGPPMITDDTETVPKGHFEINSGFAVKRDHDGRLFESPLIDFNYGLTRHLQFKIEMPWLIQHPDGRRGLNGPGNAKIGVRWRFRDGGEKHRVALSIYPQLEFNTSDSTVRRGLEERGPEFLIPLEWQTMVGKLRINGEVGYCFTRTTDELVYGLVVGREFKRLELLAEIHGTGRRDRLRESEIVYNLGSRLEIDEAYVAAVFGWSIYRTRS